MFYQILHFQTSPVYVTQKTTFCWIILGRKGFCKLSDSQNECRFVRNFPLFHVSVSFWFPAVTILFSSIIELNLFFDRAADQIKKVIFRQRINPYQTNISFLYHFKLSERGHPKSAFAQDSRVLNTSPQFVLVCFPEVFKSKHEIHYRS